MPDTTEIVAAAEKLGKMIAEHPTLKKYADAQKALGTDPDATQLFQKFDQELMKLAQQEQSGQPISDSQRSSLQKTQALLASNLRVKAFSMAQMEMTELLKAVSQAWQKPVAAAQSVGQPQQGNPPGGQPASPFAGGGGMKLSMP